MAEVKKLEQERPELASRIKGLRGRIDAIRKLRLAGVGGPALRPIRPFSKMEGLEIAKKARNRNISGTRKKLTFCA